MFEKTREEILRGWAKAYRDTPEHRFPSDPHAEFFPVDLEAAADEIEHLRLEHRHACQEIDIAKLERHENLAKALEAIQTQCDEMRSLKGWRLNLILENLAKAKAALNGSVGTAGSGS